MARNKIIGSILSILVILIIISLISGVIASDKTSNKIVNKIVDKKYDTITAYGLDIPELGQKAGVTVSSQIKEKLQTDKKVRAIVTMKEPKAVKGWSKKVAAMKTSQVKELKKAARESAINNIGRQRVKHTYNSFNGFSASLTQEEFNDLIASGMVESIEYDEPFYISLQDSTGIINATESWSLQYDGVNLTGAGQTVCVIDTGVDYTHPDLGGCTIENVTLVGNIINYSEESEHPYEDNTTVTYKINYTGFDSIAVHFVSINMELDWDFIYILDGNNNTVKNYTGHPSDIWSPHVAGDTIYIRLVADNYYNDSGFYIDKIINGTTSTTYNWSNCSKVIGGYNFYGMNPNPMDDNNHGTHCAGIVAANGEIKGVAHDSNVIAIKACDSSGGCYTAEIIKGIEYCTDNAAAYNISVISMSLGGGGYSNYCDNVSEYSGLVSAINSAVAKNISIIIATGNDGYSDKISGPACIQNATPVGATEKNDNFAGYSNRNELVQLFAPGSNINATKYPNGGYTLKSGTSMATPHVAGAFAIINQYLKLSGQSKTPQKIESIFNRTGKQIYDSASGLNYSRIDLYEALLELDGGPNITITSPEADYISTDDSVLINITSDENLSSAMLHIVDPSENISMDGSGTSWYYNLSGNGSITFFVTGNDINGFPGESENRSIFLNNSAPNITQTSPATEINISEPNNQTFSINYTNDGPSLLIEWYLNSTLIANETAEWNFTGNYSSAGSYNITISINDSVLQDEHSWILNVNDTPSLSILSKYPDNDSVVIDEPETTLFNISFTNLDDNALIIWYLNNTAQQAYENSTNYSFGGNYSCEGNYTIKVEINNSYDSVFNLWNLTVLNITQDLTPPDLTIESPENGTISTADSVLINISSNENIYNTTLHLINTSENILMTGSNQNWHYNLTGSGYITFYICANDSAGNTGYTENRTIFLNNSAPNITQTSPATEINISEPNNQTFTINYTDDGPYTSVKWYLNSTLTANETTEWNFTGNYSSAGSYNITIIINDSVLQNEHSWILNVNNTNKPLYWLHSFINLTLDEDSSITYDVNASDDENDPITYSLNTTNTTEISIDNDTGLINFTPAQDWNGLLAITITASDGVNNITEEIVFNVTPLNDAPQFTLTYNAAYNETETINITVNATDIDNDNLTYGINDTKFTNINDSFIWNTTYQDSGDHYFKVNVSDGNQVTETVINITILDLEDVDNDGINDTEDYLVGEADTIISNISLNISIGNLTNLSQEFNGIHEINISYNTSSLLEFNWTFSNTSMLNLSGITLEKQPTSASSGYLLIKGLNLTSQASTKTIYVAKLNTSIPSICIKDAEIESINNISSFCNEDDETPITCPGSSGDYNCNLSDDNNTFVITGLSHSGVRQQTYCGDDTKDGDEECDGSDFGSETCATKGYDLGTLNCNSDCIISTTSCSNRYTGGGGGGGGGGSTAVATVPSGPKYSRYFSYLGAGVLEIPIADQRIPLRNFKLRTTGPNNLISFVFQRVDDISFIENPLRNAYHYMRIEAEGIDNTTISSISFEFNINKSWFDSQYNKDKIYLERYYNNVWEKHTARFLKEVNNTYLYKAETNGMSYFAITAEQVIIERPAPVVVEEEERIKEREAVIEKAEEVPSEPASEEIPGVIEVEEEKGHGFFSRTWKKFSNLIARNIIVTLLVIIVFALLGGTGFNMYYYYISTLKQGEDDESEEDYEEEKKQKQNKAKDKAAGTAKNEHVNDWAQRHAKKGFSIDEIKGALVSRGFRDEDIDKIIFSLGEKPGKNKFIKKIGEIKKKIRNFWVIHIILRKR